MAKKMARISINKWEKALDNNVTEIPLYGVDGVTISIRYSISLMEMLQFVDDVVESCVNGETGEYLPEIKDFAIDKGVLSVYANFSMPDDVAKQYELIYNTEALEQVRRNINIEQLNSIVRAIDKKIDHKLAMMQSTAAMQTNEVVSRLNDLADQLEKSVSGMTSKDIQKFVSSIGNMHGIDEAKLARAVLADRGDTDAGIQSVTQNGNTISVTKPATM